MKDRGKYLLPWLAVLAVWSGLSYGGFLSKLIFADPHEVAISTIRMLTCANTDSWRDVCIWKHLFGTLSSVFFAFTLGSLIGLTVGTAIGSFTRIERVLSQPVGFLRAIPVTAFASVFLSLFGFDFARVALAAFGTALIMIIGVWEGIRNAPREITDAAELDGADKWQMIKHITWYLALPFTWANAKVAISLCLVLVVVGEMFMPTNTGLGRQIINAQQMYNMPLSWAIIILLGIVGVFVSKLMDILRSWVIYWE